MFNSAHQPLSIYTVPRSIRIAFIINIDDENFDKIYDSILDFNISMWGGRYNPIIPIKEGMINEEHLNLLKFCDSDIIYSFADLSNDLLNVLEKDISPLLIQRHSFNDSYNIDLSYKPISIQNVLGIYKKDPLFFFDNPCVPVINNFENRNVELCKFLKRNFGIDYDRLSNRHFHKFFKTFEIPNDSSEEDVFSLFQEQRKILFPIYFSSYYSEFFENKESFKNDIFIIHIGESPQNWINNWNRIFYLSSFKRNTLSQICLSELFLENQNNIDTLFNFFIGSGFLEQIREVCFVGTSIEKHKNMIRDVLKNKIGFVNFKKVIDNSINIEKVHKNFEDRQELKHFVLDKSDKFYIQNTVPKFLSTNDQIYTNYISETHWMLDFKIQYRPEKFNYTNLNYFWKLPRNFGLTRSFFYRLDGRVNESNYPSILVGSKLKNIELSIPEDFNCLWSTFVDKKDYLREDCRESKSKEISKISISDKGSYALAFLERFPNNWEAARFIETKFWRDFLEEMNRIDKIESEKKQTDLKNLLSKRLTKNYTSDPLKHIDWLSNLIIRKSRELKEKKEFIKYDELISRFITEREKASNESGQPENFKHSKEEDREELLDSINRLLEYAILFQGISPRCNNCGSVFWYSIDEISDLLVCKGCLTKFRVSAEEPWTYRLNNLIANAITYHGVIPIIWAQDNLLQLSDSFIFMPGVEFYQNENSKPFEVDIVAIKNGELIFCDLKTNVKGYSYSDLEKFSNICKILNPQKAIIGAIYGDKEKLALRGRELEQLINSPDIEVSTIYPDSSFFISSWWI